jgi:8-oxo-dGTP diphosphatase
MRTVVHNHGNLTYQDIDEVVLRARAVMINSDNEILLGYLDNTYQFPGGHVEKDESFVDAVIREMKEETGLDIKNPVLVGVKQFPIKYGRYVVFLYKTNEFEGELQSSNEGKMEWVEYKDISNIKTVDDFEELLKVMNSNQLSEFQYVVKDDIWNVVLK